MTSLNMRRSRLWSQSGTGSLLLAAADSGGSPGLIFSLMTMDRLEPVRSAARRVEFACRARTLRN
jgi:hypothetical protein